MTDRTHCGRCRMTFRIRDQFHAHGAEISRCSEPGCARRFQHGNVEEGHAIAVYVEAWETLDAQANYTEWCRAMRERPA